MIDIIRNTDTKTLMTGKHTNGVSYLQYVFQIYEELFNTPCTGCINNIPHYIQAIKNYKTLAMQKSTKDKRLFHLKKGIIIPIMGTRKAYSEHNLTDEIALKLISENPNRKELFEVVPKNLNQLLENEEENLDNSILVFDKPFSIEEVKSFLKVIGIDTKAKTSEGITKKLAELNDEQNVELEKLINQK